MAENNNNSSSSSAKKSEERRKKLLESRIKREQYIFERTDSPNLKPNEKPAPIISASFMNKDSEQEIEESHEDLKYKLIRKLGSGALPIGSIFLYGDLPFFTQFFYLMVLWICLEIVLATAFQILNRNASGKSKNDKFTKIQLLFQLFQQFEILYIDFSWLSISFLICYSFRIVSYHFVEWMLK